MLSKYVDRGKILLLTSGNKGIDVLNLTNGRMITITNNIQDAVKQTIYINN